MFNSEKHRAVVRCRSKRIYPTKDKAQYKCYYFKHYFNDGKTRIPYFCNICGNWHITTQTD